MNEGNNKTSKFLISPLSLTTSPWLLHNFEWIDTSQVEAYLWTQYFVQWSNGTPAIEQRPNNFNWTTAKSFLFLPKCHLFLFLVKLLSSFLVLWQRTSIQQIDSRIHHSGLVCLKRWAKFTSSEIHGFWIKVRYTMLLDSKHSWTILYKMLLDSKHYTWWGTSFHLPP